MSTETPGWTLRMKGEPVSGKPMTRTQTLHQVSKLLDVLSKREVDAYFDEFEHDPAIEAALRDRMSQWKAEELRRVDQLLCCAEAGAEPEDLVH